MAAFATPDDVDQLLPLDDAGRDAATQLLLVASALIRKSFPDIDARIGRGELDGELAKFVAAQMVLRVLRNPSGVRQETIGPSSISYDPSQASGQLALTPADLDMLAPPLSTLGIGTARLGAGLGSGPNGIVNDRAAYKPRRPPRVWPW